MAQVSKSELEIVVKALDQASGTLRKIGDETEGLSQKTKGLQGVMENAAAAIAAYAGAQGVGFLVREVEQGNMQLAQARVFLEGNVKDVNAALMAHEAFGKQMQKNIGVSDEYATLIASKLSPRYKDLSKQQEYASILLRGQRLQLFDASDAALQMSRNQEGMERTLRFLLQTMGVAEPEFVSIQTLWEEMRRKIEEGEKGLDDFSIQWNLLKEQISQFAEVAGTPLVRFFAVLLTWVNNAIQRFPVLGDIISGGLASISTALLGFAAGRGLAAFLGLSGAFGTWGLIIGAAIGGVIYYISLLDTMSTSTKEKMVAVFIGLASALALVGAFIGATFFLPLAALMAGLAIITQMSIEGYELSWKGFKQFLADTWTGITIIVKETWEAVLTWVQDRFNSFVSWIGNKVDEMIAAVNRALSAVASLPGVSAVVGAAKSVVSTISGKRAAGGSVDAGHSYLVGEQGAEIFVPNVSGTIVPNGGGTASIVIDMRGSTFIDRMAAVQIGDEIIARLKELHRLGY